MPFSVIGNNEKCNISDLMSPSMPYQSGSGKGPKPPTPIATPRCSSPPSNIFESKATPAVERSLTGSVNPQPPQQTSEDLNAQELFFNIEQLTQQAKESFDMSRKSVKSVNRETFTNVGKSVVDNISTTDWKKLKFFNALSGSNMTTGPIGNRPRVQPRQGAPQPVPLSTQVPTSELPIQQKLIKVDLSRKPLTISTV